MENVQILLTSDFDPTARGYRKRKIFPKSRSGCLSCKVKKVKCDESKPICSRCRRNIWHCEYMTGNNCIGRRHREPSNPLPQASATSSLSFPRSFALNPFSTPSSKNGTPSTHILQHCFRCWDEIFHFACSYQVVSIFHSNPVTRNVILAIAACHLRHMAPTVLEHRIAEHFQQSVALQGYRKILATPLRDLGQYGVNMLLLSGTLLSVLGFPLPPESRTACGSESDVTSSWVFSSHHHRMGWLVFQAGIRPLLKSTQLYYEEAISFLGPILLGSNQTRWSATRIGVPGMTPAWAAFFGLEIKEGVDRSYWPKRHIISDPGSSTMQKLNIGSSHKSTDGEIYRELAKVAAYLRAIEPIPLNAFRHLTFLAKATQKFQVLLHDRDEKALWLYGYWFGLICRMEGLWWCQQRARREYEAIRIWLRQLRLTERPGYEGELWQDMMIELDAAPFFTLH
ncbi:hypothetical protein BX600DRAFT_100992 [Xylariales sp. PMI_506]|nr:hypothetical protein BX600DRAFT_100992 [Xylariales sp. PMI_506]